MQRKCSKLNGMSYCGYSDPNPTKTIVYFHGLLDDSKALEISLFDQSDLKSIIEANRPASVILVSYGRNWVIKSNAINARITAEKVKENIELLIERNGLPRKFYGIGISEGGLNLAILSASYPDFFDRVVFVSSLFGLFLCFVLYSVHCFFFCSLFIIVRFLHLEYGFRYFLLHFLWFSLLFIF
jgi:poly(3-hydroxybutyrate) depolymerase